LLIIFIGIVSILNKVKLGLSYIGLSRVRYLVNNPYLPLLFVREDAAKGNTLKNMPAFHFSTFVQSIFFLYKVKKMFAEKYRSLSMRCRREKEKKTLLEFVN
jgi:hypothetical protein